MSDIPSTTTALLLAMVDHVVAAEAAAHHSEDLLGDHSLPLAEHLPSPSLLSSTDSDPDRLQNDVIGKIVLIYGNAFEYV